LRTATSAAGATRTAYRLPDVISPSWSHSAQNARTSVQWPLIRMGSGPVAARVKATWCGAFEEPAAERGERVQESFASAGGDDQVGMVRCQSFRRSTPRSACRGYIRWAWSATCLFPGLLDRALPGRYANCAATGPSRAAPARAPGEANYTRSAVLVISAP